MKKIALKIILLTLVSTFLFSCSKDDSEEMQLAERNQINVSYSGIETEIISLINNYRSEKGLSTLNTFNIVSSEAESHTNYMIEKGEVSHANFGRRFQNLVNYADAKSVAENVAYGYSSAQAVVNAWLNSEGHRKNIENPEFTDFGISTESNNEGRNYFTNIFIKR